ncbi:MAG: CVNH domain-containing protein [Rhizobiaceae bacterium]
MAMPSKAMNWQEGMDPANLRGTFYASCAACSVDGGSNLTCRCTKQNGLVGRETSIALSFCSRSGPNNTNGYLTCAPIIRGSWAQSCTVPLIYRRSMLTAQCKDTSGNYQPTEINLDDCPSMNIENNNGRLQCKD